MKNTMLATIGETNEKQIRVNPHTKDEPNYELELVKTYADKFISFNEIEEKTWDDIDTSEYKPFNFNEKIGEITSNNNLDVSILMMPISDWIKSAYTKIFNEYPNQINLSMDMFDLFGFMNDLLIKFKFSNDILINTVLEFDDDDNGIISDNKSIIICLDKNGLLIHKNYGSITIYYSSTYYLRSDNNKLKSLLSVAKSYKKPKIQENHISIIYNDGMGLTKNKFELKKRDINIEENYNDDFIDVSKDLIKKLNDKNKTGLFILHGEHGTGKTTYIRYLASILKREVIFVPPDMVDVITSPSFIGFLMENPDTVLIIEDGEAAIQQRNNVRTNGVANILNMTDGLLSDCLNISIVVTFNTNTKNLDDALLRKGRLLKRYEFGKLSTEKSQKLLNKLKIDKKATAPMRLSDIYYADDNNQTDEFTEKKIVKGFGNKK